MKSTLPILSALVISALVSCSKNASDSSQTCSVTYTDAAPLSSGQQIHYLVGVTGGGGSVSSISYQDSAGTTTVQNPAVPFEKFVNLASGATVTIGATGNAKTGGHIIVSAFIDGAQKGTSCP